MAWTAPMTAVAGSVFTASQFNTFVRDNMAETAPAKATTPGSIFATSATNQITERTPNAAVTLAQDTTTSTTYTDLDLGVGPQLTITTGVACFVIISAAVQNNTTSSARMTYDISGASSRAGADNRGIATFGGAGVGNNIGVVVLEQTLTPGSNIFTAKYRVAGGTGTFNSRRIQVLPL